MQVLFAGSFTFLRKNLFLFPAITVFAFLQVLLASFTMLALSSLSKSSRYVGILYAGVIFFTDAIYGMLCVMTRSVGRVAGSRRSANLTQVGDVDLPPPAALRHALAGLARS